MAAAAADALITAMQGRQMRGSRLTFPMQDNIMRLVETGSIQLPVLLAKT